jgi:hypothetical protein
MGKILEPLLTNDLEFMGILSMFSVISEISLESLEFFIAFAMDRASIANNAHRVESAPMIKMKMVARAQPPVRKTQGMIRGPVPIITFTTIAEVTRGFCLFIDIRKYL